MPQTLLALLALMTATTMSLTWQRDTIRAQMNTIEDELQIEARGVANEVFETVANLPFDENTPPSAPIAKSTTDLSPEWRFGSDRHWGDTSVDDIDDYHNMRPSTIIRTVTNPLDGTDVDVRFEITAKVDYVSDDSGDELKSTGGVRTFYKRFEVQILPKIGYADASRDTIRVSRVFSYDF